MCWCAWQGRTPLAKYRFFTRGGTMIHARSVQNSLWLFALQILLKTSYGVLIKRVRTPSSGRKLTPRSFSTPLAYSLRKMKWQILRWGGAARVSIVAVANLSSMSLRVARAGESKLYGIFRFVLKTVGVQPVNFWRDWLTACGVAENLVWKTNACLIRWFEVVVLVATRLLREVTVICRCKILCKRCSYRLS